MEGGIVGVFSWAVVEWMNVISSETTIVCLVCVCVCVMGWRGGDMCGSAGMCVVNGWFAKLWKLEAQYVTWYCMQ